MKKKDKQDLIKYKDALRFVSNLRIFPNNRKMNLFESTSLNQLGKLLEKLQVYLYNLMEGKKERKILRIIGSTDAKLEREMYKKKIIDSRE